MSAPWTRRDFCRISGAGLLGTGGLANRVFADVPDAKKTGAPALIEIALLGGLSHIDSFDPKPDAASDCRGEFGTTATSIAGVHFSQHLPRLAGIAKQFAVLRAVSHRDTLHETSQRYLLTGDSTQSAGAPEVGCVVAAREKRGRTNSVPAYIAIPGITFFGDANDLGSPAYNLLEGGGAILSRAQSGSVDKALADYHRRDNLLRQLDSSLPATINQGVLARRQEAYATIGSLLGSKALTGITRLDRETPKMRETYGTHRWGEYLLMARRAIEAGSRVVTVVLDGWDMHSDIFASLRLKLPPLDQALAALIEDLAQRGLLPTTTVVAFGEFGRTPKVNDLGGRDHWPQAMTMLWAGGGSKGGRVIGSTDKQGGSPKDGTLSLENVIFTIYHQLGIDPATVSLAPEERKLFLGKKDLLIRDLF
ncbi:DUF1501 domain-containing protein [soil metagenome]